MMASYVHVARLVFFGSTLLIASASVAHAKVGLGARPIEDAEVIFDGTRKMLDEKWTYWKGPRFSSSLPIKWKIVADPVDNGTVVMTDDPAAAGGKYGTADVVTKEKYRDFRLHVEFLVVEKGGNSGVYLQNRYEIQILDGDKGKHGMGAVINETPAPYHALQRTPACGTQASRRSSRDRQGADGERSKMIRSDRRDADQRFARMSALTRPIATDPGSGSGHCKGPKPPSFLQGLSSRPGRPS